MATGQDIQEVVIKPMLATFPPPTHLRGNSYAIQESLNVYRRSLARFERPVLELAWQKAAAEAEYRIWPTCAAIVKAAEYFNARYHPAPRNPDQWVDKARVMADSYTARFMKTSQTAVRAREGGYAERLKAFVWEGAWVQGQALLGRRGISYTSTVLFPNGEGPEEREEWFGRARKQAKTGFIRVSIPGELLKQWKEQSQSQGRGR